MKTDRKVAILLATSNRQHLIVQTLDSIKQQSFSNWECIIVDDFSTDRTKEVVEEYTKSDSRFKFFQKPPGMNKGLSASRNYGLELIKARVELDFIQFFDDDDLMHPEKLRLQVKSLVENPKADFSLCGPKNFRDLSEITWNESFDRINTKNLSFGEAYLVGEIRFVAQVPLFRYQYAKNFKFDEDFFYAEEWVLFSQTFLLKEPSYTELQKTLFYRRKHAESVTENKDIDFKKRKTTAITDIKIFQFLTEKSAHTKITLFYFGRKFLLYQYDSNMINSLKKEIAMNETTTRLDFLKFVLATKFRWIVRKIVLRLLKL